MTWRANKKDVKVFRASLTVVEDQDLIDHEKTPDPNITSLTIQELSHNETTSRIYGKEALGRIRIKLEENESLSLYDRIEFNGSVYEVDSVEVARRLFRTIDAKWVLKVQI